MSICKIFPEIYNTNGELVESQLFIRLLEQGYSRNDAVKLWGQVRSERFFKENGNWLLAKDLQSGRVKDINFYESEEEAQEALTKFNRVYGKSFVDQEIINYDDTYAIKLQNVTAGDIKVELDSNGEPVEFQKRLSAEEKFFRAETGLTKSTGNGNYRAAINSAVKKFNAKHGTAHYVNWKQMGQSDLFKVDTIDWRWGNFSASQTSLFQKEEVNSEAVEVLNSVVEKLTGNTGIAGQVISESEAQDLLGNNYNGEPAFFYQNQVYLVAGKASLESAFHEFAHPLINQVYLTNRELFNKLYDELSSTYWGKAIIEEVEALYGNDSEENFKKEAVVRALGRLARDKNLADINKSFLSKLLNLIKRAINNLLGRKVQLDKLSSNTTLREFANMLGVNTSKKIETSKQLTVTRDTEAEFQRIDPNSNLEKIVNKSELIVSKQLAIFKERMPIGKTNKQIEALEEALDKIRKVQEVVDYLQAIEVVIKSMDTSEKKLLEIKKAGFDKKNASFLKNTEEFLSSLSFLEELSRVVRTGEVEAGDVYTPMIRDAIQRRSDLLGIYKEVSLDFLSELLFNEIDPAILEESKQRKQEMLAKNPKNARARLIITSKEEMREHLTQASKDISSQNLWLYSTAASNDPALSLGALYVKRNLEEAASDTILVAEQMNAALQLYKASRPKVNIDNPREFNDAVTEIVEDIIYEADPETGETTPKIIKRYTLVNEFDITAFNREYLKMKSDQDKTTDPKEKRKIFAAWAGKNIEFIPGYKEVILAKQAELGPDSEAYKQWHKANILVYQGNYSPKFGGELWQPIQKYRNAKWDSMSDADREYHRTMSDTLTQHQEKLPNSMVRKLKLANFNHVSVIPSRYKTTRERVLDKQYGKVKEDFVESLKVNQEREKEFGLVKLDGEPFYGIPIHHTQNMNVEDISPDIFTNILFFTDSVNKRTRLQQTEAEMLLLKDALNTRKLERVTQDGTTIVDIFRRSQIKRGKTNAERFGDIPEAAGEGGNAAQKFSEFIDVMYYGQSSLPAGNLFGKYSINQITNKLLGYMGMTQLAFNIPSAAANKVVGDLNNIGASFGGRYFSAADYWKARGEYNKKYIPNTILDMGNPIPKTLQSKILQVLDPLQGTFRDMTGKVISQSTLLREFRRDHLFFLNNMGEHSMQVTNMIAIMNATKVTNTQTGEIKSLNDVIKGVNDSRDEFILEEGFEFSKEQTERLRNKIHRVNQKLHGNYSNSIDMIMLQRRWYGKLALMFRKYIVPGMQRRWDVEHLDFETGEFEAGIYVDAYQHFMNEVVRKIKYHGKGLAMEQHNVSDKVKSRRKAAMYQTLFEAGIFLLTMLVGNLAVDEDDDKKDPWAMYQLALLMRRVRGDMSFYINPLDFINILKNPTVASNFTVDFIKFILGLLFVWGEDEYYDRNIGAFKKGDSKDWARFMKIVPLLRQIKNIQEPQEQIKFFSLMSI